MRHEVLDKNLIKKRLIILGGIYSNKGSIGILKGTFNVFEKLDVDCAHIIDPEYAFPKEFFAYHNLTPIYRWSDTLGKKKVSSINPSNAFIPFLKCLIRSYSSELRQLQGFPLWQLGDSGFNEFSRFTLVGKIIDTLSLKYATKGKLILGGMSVGQTRTEFGKLLLRHFFKSVDYFFVRESGSYNNLVNLGVNKNNISIICDFAFHLKQKSTQRSIYYSKPINKTEKISIGLIIKDFFLGFQQEQRENYIQAIKKLGRKLERLDYQIFLIPMGFSFIKREDDTMFIQEIFGNRYPIIETKDLDPEEIIEVIGNLDAVITIERKHGAIFSSLAGVPLIYIYYDPGGKGIMKDTLGEIVPLIKISDFAKGENLNDVIEILENLLLKKEEISSKMKECIEAEKKRSIEVLKMNLNSVLNW